MIFEIKILLRGRQRPLQARKLNKLKTTDDYWCYEVSGLSKRSVIYVNPAYWRAPMVFTAQDAWEHYEKIRYPEMPWSYSEERVFNALEIQLIGQAIGEQICREEVKSLIRS